MNKYKWVAVLIFLTFAFTLGLWAVDIGASGMSAGARVVGGFGTRSPAQHYHLGLLICSVSFLATVFIAARFVLRR